VTIQHIIFDCDGVLVDSEPLSMRIDVEILAENGVVMGEDEAHRRFVGKTFAAMIAEVTREFGASFPPGASSDKDRRLLDLYERELKPVPGIAEALHAIAMAPYSVASNSPAQRVAEALRITGLTPHFGSRITTFEHVVNGKPEPDVFIEAARRVSADPAKCLVIEDSVTGVTAAKRAGCPVLGFTGTHSHPGEHAGRLAAAGAGLTFRYMAELPGLVAGFVKPARGMI
jgi:HAD superfamily hydrolase (TIGR01509 family)